MSDENIIQIGLPLDEEGFIGRQCPNSDCQRYFKIKDGTGIVDPNHEMMFCPYCEQVHSIDDFHTEDQMQYADSALERIFFDKAEKIFRDAFQNLPQSNSRNSFVTLTWSYEPGTPPDVHEYAEQELQTTITCENCGLVYAIWVIFSICPDCGKHNLFQITGANLNNIERQITLWDNLYTKFGNTEAAFLTVSVAPFAPQWIESAYLELVTTFETFCKHLDQKLLPKASDPNKKKQGNVFQRLNDAGQWFLDQYNLDLFAALSAADLDQLKIVFSKRHLLIHNMGIIDEIYAKANSLSGDMPGRKVETTKTEVQQAVDIVRKIVNHARSIVI